MKQMNVKISQEGYALLFLTGLISILGVGILLDYINLNRLANLTYSSEELDETLLHEKILFEAKNAVIGQSFNAIASNVANGFHPAQLIAPDRLTNTQSTYKGVQNNNCYHSNLDDSSNYHLQYCLGRLPYSDLGVRVYTSDQTDPKGLMPWYAVSLPLMNPLFKPVNPVTLRQNSFDAFYKTEHTSYLPSLFGNRKPLLTINDENNNLLTDKAIAVVMIPNKPINSQTRSLPTSGKYPDNLNDIQKYLDSPNNDLDDQFVKNLSKSTLNFNDKLIYITIDDIIPLLERRVINEADRSLASYWQTHHMYPDWVNLNNQTIQFATETLSFKTTLEWSIVSKYDNKGVLTLPKTLGSTTYFSALPNGLSAFLNGTSSENQTECTFDSESFEQVICNITYNNVSSQVLKRVVQIKNKITATSLKAKILENGYRTLNTKATFNTPDYLVLVTDTVLNANGSTSTNTLRYYGTSVDLTLKMRDLPRMPLWYTQHDWHQYLKVKQWNSNQLMNFKLIYTN